MTRARYVASILAAVAATLTASAVSAQPGHAQAATRNATAVTYEARRTTKIDLVGTPLLPRARGEVEITAKAAGPLSMKVKVRGLSAASQFGPEYLTFVLWAIPPQGRAKNLGELRSDDGEAEIETSVEMQTFAVIATAEPYFAVTTPSDTVAMENAVREDTRGTTSIAALSYEIVPRRGYVAGASDYSTPSLGKREPVDLQQARNAVAIATIADASTFAGTELLIAQTLVKQVEQLVAARGSHREIISQSRAAVQAAEAARLQSTGRRAAADAAAKQKTIRDRR